MRIEKIRCKFCDSEQLQRFTAEMAVHFPGLKNIDTPHVYISADLLVCLNCGTAQFAVPQAQLCQLAKGAAAAG